MSSADGQQKRKMASVQALVEWFSDENGELLSRDQVIVRLNKAGIIWTPARLLEAMLRAQAAVKKPPRNGSGS